MLWNEPDQRPRPRSRTAAESIEERECPVHTCIIWQQEPSSVGRKGMAAFRTLVEDGLPLVG